MRTAEDIAVRPITRKDLRDVARVHARAFPESAVTRLGSEAVRRYYVWQLEGPHRCCAQGAFVDGKLAGFCFSGVFNGALSGYLRKNRLFLAGRLLIKPHLVMHPLFCSRLLEGVRVLRKFGPKVSGVETSGSGDDTGNGAIRVSAQKAAQRLQSCGILSVAVDPGYQGRGIGRLLMDAAEREARKQGFGRMHLTVSPENAQAVRFYELQGWKRLESGGSWNGRMDKVLKV